METNIEKLKEAYDICLEKKQTSDMKLIDVEYTFDTTKFFHFTADGRVDFRSCKGSLPLYLDKN